MNENREFSLEEILDEERKRRDGGEPPAEEEAPEEAPPKEEPAAPRPQPAPKREEVYERTPDREEDEDIADLNAYATGNNPPPRDEYYEEEEEPREKKKKKRRGFFGRRKKVPEFDESDDVYYGLQLKPIDEYRKGFDPVTGEFTLDDAEYQSLFDDSKKAVDDEVELNFKRLQQERRRRVAEAVKNAGVDAEEIASEFGVVAPMPVSSFAADPYVKEHGLGTERSSSGGGSIEDYEQAMAESSQSQDVEIRLNTQSDTMEIHRINEEEPSPPRRAVSDDRGSAPPQEFEDISSSGGPGEFEDISSSDTTGPGEEPAANDMDDEAPPEVIEGRESEEVPHISYVYEYRSRDIPTHIINVDTVQSALLSESEDLMREGGDERPRRRRTRERDETPERSEPAEDIDDYTGREDARSISEELRGDMHALTLRLGITAVCFILGAIFNIVFSSRMKGTEDGGTAGIVYVILSAVLLFVPLGVCYRTVAGGLKALFNLTPNADSGLAVAAVAVAAETLVSVFFRTDLAGGNFYLYGVILNAMLFLNCAGKLTMLRRIHSNFRFVTSKEQKYAASIYGDYNNAVKLTKDCVEGSPALAYQSKAGFLRRFLELSYSPDVSETVSQSLAPVGLLASLIVCAVSLFITNSIPMAMAALAASSLAFVAAGNLLVLNLPVSRLCKTARRAGGMAVGYKAVEEFGGTNAVLVDAGEIFPRGTVVLNGIKTQGGKAAAEQAILLASALMQRAGGPLLGVFDQVISENEGELPEVESVSYDTGAGIRGKVDGKDVYIGTRNLMLNHSIDVPDRELENQMASGNQMIIYIAVDTSVCAMLSLTYTADRRKRNELTRLEQNGVSVVIRTNDPNVTPAFISRLFGIDAASVGVVDAALGDSAKEILEAETPRADAVVATKGRAESLMRIVSACVELKRSAGLTAGVQVAGMILGFLLVAFLACFGAIGRLPSWILFLFEGLFLALELLIPKVRR